MASVLRHPAGGLDGALGARVRDGRRRDLRLERLPSHAGQVSILKFVSNIKPIMMIGFQ